MSYRVSKTDKIFFCHNFRLLHNIELLSLVNVLTTLLNTQ